MRFALGRIAPLLLALVLSPSCGGDDDDTGPGRDSGGPPVDGGGDGGGPRVDGGGDDDGGGPPVDGRLPGDREDPARGAIDFWEVSDPDMADVNPELDGLWTSAKRAVAVVAQDASVGDVNAALDATAMRIVGGMPGGILVVDIAEPDFTALRAAVETLLGSGAFTTASEDMVTVGEIVPPDSQAFADSGAGVVGENRTPWPWKWDEKPTGANWYLEWVKAPAVWNLVRVLERQQCGNVGAVVGVVDGGMQSHPDLTRVSWEAATDHFYIPGDPNAGFHALAVSGMIAAGSLANDDDGIEGVNPWASIVGRNLREVELGEALRNVADAGKVMGSTSQLLEDVTAFVLGRSAPLIINLSQNWPWAPGRDGSGIGYNPDLRNRTLVDAAVDAGALEAWALIEGLTAAGLDFLIFQAAGNDRDDFGGAMTARFGSPFSAAALDLGGAAEDHVLVIEAIGLAQPPGWDVRLSAFSQSNGSLSAPGEHLGVLVAPGPYSVEQGTSEASPLAAGVASLLTMFNPGIGSAGIVSALRRSARPGQGGASAGVDALGAVLSLDGENACGTWKKAMVDVDDGSEHGLERWTFDDAGTQRIDTDDSGPDGVIDMADFRAFRTAYDHYATGLGPDAHPKLDLNGNGRHWAGDGDFEHHARHDFNGDGRIDSVVVQDTQLLLGEQVSDLDLLSACFVDNGEGWTGDDLDDLMSSADLLFRLQWVEAEMAAHLSEREEDVELEAIEIRWPTAGGTHTKRLGVPLPKELLMTVPLSGGPLEIVAFAGGREVCGDLAPTLQLASSDHVLVPVHVTCGPGETCCDDGCKALRWDEDNCGQCGSACADDEECDDGRCRPAGTCGPIEDPVVCELPEGRCCDCESEQSCAVGGCHDPTDPLTCEGCDSPCNWGEACCQFTCCPHGSSCCPGDPTQCCTWGEDVCHGARLDVTADPINCGGCDSVCPDGWECCHGACVNPDWDRMNCGGCDVGCMPSEACCDGSCTSMASATSCGGCPGITGQDCTLSDDGCCNANSCGLQGCPATCTQEIEGLTCDPVTGMYYDLQSDSANCGAFGVVCPPPGRCIAGDCVLPWDNDDPENCFWTGLVCVAGACCDGRCTDLETDRENCGACGAACPFGFDWECCEGSCVNIRSDHENCWSCGQACAGDEECCNGQCTDVTTDRVNCGECASRCEETLPMRPWQDVDWADPWPQPVPACCDSECVEDTPAYDEPNCGGCGIECAEGETCCAGRCLNAMTDDANCGFCHNACAEGLHCCGGECRNLMTSRTNCGACGNDCGEMQSCVGGGCVCDAI